LTLIAIAINIRCGAHSTGYPDFLMKVSNQQAATNRERILNEATRLFREQGFDKVGVDALTRAAGLTHGGLYSHFGSKEALMAQALSHGRAQTAETPPQIKTIADAVSVYLSSAHRDNPGAGCYMAALGCDIHRQNKEVRQAFTEIVRTRVKQIAALSPKHPRRDRESEALATIATMVGAITLARAVDDPELSDRILAESRMQILRKT
jgi:TetR/AcrR family transcriptional regulator, transcriptional repressor for nem operon